jgi:hypothetical protein
MQFPNNLPWFIFDLYNYQLITSTTIPEGDIKDTKPIIYAETPIPGRNFQPISPGGNGNRRISFTLPILNKSNPMGNMLLLKQFDLLRNQAQGFLGTAANKGQFSPNPKVLYYWGSGSVPLVWFVAKCDYSSQANMVNAFGSPQYTRVEIELILDETNELYKMEEAFRNVAALLGEAAGAYGLVKQGFGLGSPY